MENITNIKTINSNKILLITDNVTAFNKTKKTTMFTNYKSTIKY